MNEEQKAKYPKTNMFEILDTISSPHPYVLGSKHVQYAHDYHGSVIGKDSIRNMERAKGHGCCCLEDCQLTYDEHELGLIVGVRSTLPLDKVAGLEEYLQSCAEQAELDGVKGFSFKQLLEIGS